MSSSSLLPSDSFRQALSETVAWCSGQTIETDPVEDAEIIKRRRFGEKAARLGRRAFLAERFQFWKSWQYARAGRLFQKARLAEIAPLQNQLGSAFVKPQPFASGQDSEDRASIVEDLVKRRADCLRDEGRYPQTILSGLANGRLLEYVPDENLFDGAARYSSKGFFDVDNVPAWDTWVCFFQGRLISWVPSQLVELVNEGLDANPERCILWVE
jgi:hypothetical protein